MKKKSIATNVLMMVLSTILFLAGMLLMPFFWKWYEVKLDDSADYVAFGFFALTFVIYVAMMMVNGFIIDSKIKHNKRI